ncbi:MAG TPA: methionyl-tRNA formyltransferase [Sphingomicrobium sp.]|nr:methionyl-tRNA formyltransferase [Sphingomicrobium sp.]
MRIIFMGTPEFAVPTLNALVDAGHDVAAVYCQPPRPAGRGKALRASPVQERTEELGLEVRHPVSLKGADEQAAFAALEADIAIVAAYGLILPRAILDGTMLGCINVHASLLPRWRGAAPVQRAILAGDKQTGVTIMQMDAGLDTGPMLLKRVVPTDEKNAAQLTEDLAELGASMMAEVLEDLPSFEPIPQPEEGVTYAAKVSKEEARLDFALPASIVKRQVRAFAPRPGAWFEFAGERVKLLDARAGDTGGRPGEVLDDCLNIACGEGSIGPLKVQRAGRAPMAPDELLHGFPIPAGTILQ